ncbi:hypothetical protein EIP86_010111 [Pleurotus ostreatoroseus]|nr:hypothetical protein EIP86_010111 [Pleurotus ostreatoroseus]
MSSASSSIEREHSVDPDVRTEILHTLAHLRLAHPTRWLMDVILERVREHEAAAITTDRQHVAVAQLHELLHHSMMFCNPNPAAEQCMAHAIHVIMHDDLEDTADTRQQVALHRAEAIIARARDVYPELRDRLDAISREFELRTEVRATLESVENDLSSAMIALGVSEDDDDLDSDMPPLCSGSDSEDSVENDDVL